MAPTKNNPGSKSTEQRGQDTSFGNAAGRINPNETQPKGDDTPMSGARTNTSAGSQLGRTPDARGGKTPRNDRDGSGDRSTTGQNPTNARESDRLDEDNAGTSDLPASDELDGEVTGDAETDIDEGTDEDIDADADMEDDRGKVNPAL